MQVSRLREMTGIGVDRMGHAADESGDDAVLRLENLDTDLRPPPGVVEATQQAATLDSANSYLPFRGDDSLRQAAAARVSRVSGVEYDWTQSAIICAGGLNGILNVLLAILEPGDEVVMTDPIYVGLVNRVRMAGGVPVFVPYRIVDGIWRLDRAELDQRVSGRTSVFLMMSPSMPTGAVFTREDWGAICAACRRTPAWMVYNSAMERILFDGIEPIHPASFPGMSGRTITVGSVSKEYRMIGWRVGWIVGPPEVMEDVGMVSISNALSPVGIAQAAAAVALRTPDADIAAATAEWERRRDVLVEELAEFPVVKPLGGWSMLCDVSGFGLTGSEASARLLERAKIAATPMTGWGSEGSDRFIRFVYSNEPVARLRGIRGRIAAAWR